MHEYFCLHVCLCTWCMQFSWNQKRASGQMELKLQRVITLHVWVLRIEPWFFGRTVLLTGFNIEGIKQKGCKTNQQPASNPAIACSLSQGWDKGLLSPSLEEICFGLGSQLRSTYLILAIETKQCAYTYYTKL